MIKIPWALKPKTVNWQKMLDRYMHDFEKRNPNLPGILCSSSHGWKQRRICILILFRSRQTANADLKRGVFKEALEAQGFIGGSRSDTEWNQWVASEKKFYHKLCLSMVLNGIKNTHEKHKTVSEFKKKNSPKKSRSWKIKRMSLRIK